MSHEYEYCQKKNVYSHVSRVWVILSHVYAYCQKGNVKSHVTRVWVIMSHVCELSCHMCMSHVTFPGTFSGKGMSRASGCSCPKTCVYACVSAYVCVRVRSCVRVYVCCALRMSTASGCSCPKTCVYACVYVCVCVCVRVCVCMCVLLLEFQEQTAAAVPTCLYICLCMCMWCASMRACMCVRVCLCVCVLVRAGVRTCVCVRIFALFAAWPMVCLQKSPIIRGSFSENDLQLYTRTRTMHTSAHTLWCMHCSCTCLQLQVILRERATKYSTILRKIPMRSGILWVFVTLYECATYKYIILAHTYIW